MPRWNGYMELVSDSRERASRYIHTPAHLRYGFALLVAPRSPEAHGCSQSILQGRDTELAQSSSRVEHNTLRSCEKVQTLLGKWNADKKKAPSYLAPRQGRSGERQGRAACVRQAAGHPFRRPKTLFWAAPDGGLYGLEKSVELPARALCISNCTSLLGKPKLCVCEIFLSFSSCPSALGSPQRTAGLCGCCGCCGCCVCCECAWGRSVRCEGVGFARAHNLCRESI